MSSIELASVELLLEGEVPVLVALVPPEILQAAPELVRLLDAADFLAARGFRLGGKLEDEAAQRFLEAVGELFVVHAVGAAELTPKGDMFAAEVKGAGETPAVRKPLAPLDCADWAGPSMGTIEASGLTV